MAKNVRETAKLANKQKKYKQKYEAKAGRAHMVLAHRHIGTNEIMKCVRATACAIVMERGVYELI